MPFAAEWSVSIQSVTAAAAVRRASSLPAAASACCLLVLAAAAAAAAAASPAECCPSKCCISASHWYLQQRGTRCWSLWLYRHIPSLTALRVTLPACQILLLLLPASQMTAL